MGMAPKPSSGGMAGKIVVSSPVEYYAAMEKNEAGLCVLSWKVTQLSKENQAETYRRWSMIF